MRREEEGDRSERTRLLLIRHGQTVHNVALRLAGWTDSPLSPEGLRQIERLAGHLAETETIHALYTSPLQRARQTAEAVARRLGLTPRYHDDLRELHFGECENLTFDEIQAQFPDLLERARNSDDPTFGWPGGESRAVFFERVRRVFAEIVGAHPASTVAVVAHGGVLGAILAEWIDGNASRWTKYTLNNCSISEVEIANGVARLVRCNVDGFTLG